MPNSPIRQPDILGVCYHFQIEQKDFPFISLSSSVYILYIFLALEISNGAFTSCPVDNPFIDIPSQSLFNWECQGRGPSSYGGEEGLLMKLYNVYIYICIHIIIFHIIIFFICHMSYKLL